MTKLTITGTFQVTLFVDETFDLEDLEHELKIGSTCQYLTVLDQEVDNLVTKESR